MSILVKLVADYALWLYVLLALVGLWLLRAMGMAIRERSRSIFALERENAVARLNRAVINFLFLLLFAGGIFYVSTTLIEQVPLPVVTPTPTQVVSLPPTLTPPPLLPTPTPTATPLPRPTPFEQPQTPTTPEAGTSQGNPPNCPHPGAYITQPGTGAVVSGVIQIVGAANIETFDYYKIEFLAPGGDWNFIQSYPSPVQDGLLATWNTATVPPGEYGFRLVVVDKTGNYPEPCQIRLTVQP